VSRSSWLTKNDKKLLNAIFDRRHMKHKDSCQHDCEPGWAKIPMKELKKTASMGQAALNETIERLVTRGVVKEESNGIHAGRDGATRYRIINLPPYDPVNTSQEEEGTKQSVPPPTNVPVLTE
jgi:hypothetical protein